MSILLGQKAWAAVAKAGRTQIGDPSLKVDEDGKPTDHDYILLVCGQPAIARTKEGVYGILSMLPRLPAGVEVVSINIGFGGDTIDSDEVKRSVDL